MGEKEARVETIPEGPAQQRQKLIETLEANQELRRQIDRLTQELAQLRHHLFGRSSEKLTPSQLTLGFTAQSFPAELPPPAPKSEPTPSPGHGRKPLPAHLPRKEVVHDVPDAEKSCKGCGGPLVLIGRETAQRLEFKPASFFIQEDVRLKYACKPCQGNVVIAEPPAQVIDKGLPGPGVLAHIAVSKYADHLPLYRLEGIFARHGIEIARSTLCGWVSRLCELLQPIYDAMKRDVLSSKLIHTDDTTVRVLDNSREDVPNGRVWVYVGDRKHRQSVYHFSPTHERRWPEEFLRGYRGYMQADAYTGYDAIYARGDIIEVGCWAHTRRHFHEAKLTDETRSLAALAYVHQLYEVEAAARELSAAERQTLRQERSRPVVEAFGRWMEEQAQAVLPKSALGQAISYASRQWPALLRYLADGDLDIDNTEAERQLRGVAVGRKNYLFFGSEEGGERAAVIYSLISSCKQNGVEPFAYLRDVIQRVSTHAASAVDELMPRLWKPA